MVKRPRLTRNPPAESPACKDNASKHSALESAYDPLASYSRFITTSRPTPLRVDLLPTPSFAFTGMSPIASFLASSPRIHFNALTRVGPEEKICHREIIDERVNYSAFQGIKYNTYPCDEVPHSMLYDNITPDK
jgi:hypothetical protein